jgi:TPP-dependent pyruvate/acetoin dehydrogenase alpha subunit
MPRKKLDLSLTVEHLSILDEKGKPDKHLEPEIPEDLLLKLHRVMVLGRRFDERLLNLQRQGRMGTFAPITGQEAAQLGAVALLRPSDWFVPSFRETAAELWRGRSRESVILVFAGYSDGALVGKEGDEEDESANNMPVAVPVASQIPHAAGIQVDGNDVLAVYAAAKEAVERARKGDGPSLIECMTYRMKMHTTADDPKRYRKEEEVEEWKQRDPLSRFQQYLKDKGLLSDEKIEELEGQIQEEIKVSVERAEKLMKDFTNPLQMFDHAYAELPPYLKEQREELAEEVHSTGEQQEGEKEKEEGEGE